MTFKVSGLEISFEALGSKLGHSPLQYHVLGLDILRLLVCIPV